MVVVLVSDQTKLDSALRIFRKKGQKEGLIKEARRRKEGQGPREGRLTWISASARNARSRDSRTP